MSGRNLRWYVAGVVWCTVLSPIGLIVLLARLLDSLEQHAYSRRNTTDRSLKRSITVCLARRPARLLVLRSGYEHK